MTGSKQPGFAVATAPGQKPILNSIFEVSAEFLGQLRLWLEQNPPAVGISNIIGFSQFAVQNATSVLATETTLSTSYVDLATVGPKLSNLPDGQYVFVFGCVASNSVSGDGSLVSIDVNGVGAQDNDGSQTRTTVLSSVMRAVPKTLSGGGNNTVTCKYRVGVLGDTGTFAFRWLFALKYANK